MLDLSFWRHEFVVALQVIHMDVRGNVVKLDDGTQISYDKCLIATGNDVEEVSPPAPQSTVV